MDMIGYFLVAILFLYIFFKIFTWPLKIAAKILVNGFIGLVLLILSNFLGSFFGISIGINLVTILIAGFCGIPGVVLLLFVKLIL
ncbi:pro-sigmaK processing inhibitor BofA family protein [Clostridium oryzae]|uniref:SigmaK-factor processing regulatory protein BofA n=1 Tax=Clostridium oryzae TaxID=1450648 RepID=A0A1V4IXP3_9CLOT|nr:pro-sigmaK processing inhibitor BofA family protein [Clostridium oryzae]OPJ64663.1 sigmaK-factor processing regulatory protein BofA [Clostridium oryzae]